jgi:[ribosomal protein S5]-alanine N-acetyltransferase
MSEIIFETERLQCRKLTSGDFQAMLEVYGDADAMRWVGDGSPLTEDEAKRWLEVTENNYYRRGYGMFALVEKSIGNVIGFCGIVHPGGQQEAEVKYAFLRSRWGQGFATEAVKELIRYGRRKHGLAYIIATVAPENLASQNVLSKVSMSKGELQNNEDGSQTQVFEWHDKEDSD